MESGYTAKTEPTGFSDGLHVQYWRKIKITGDPGMTPNIDLSKQEEGSYHKKKKKRKKRRERKKEKKNTLSILGSCISLKRMKIRNQKRDLPRTWTQ